MAQLPVEPSSPVQKVWKPELYKMQLQAPRPKPLHRSSALPAKEETPAYYGNEYYGMMSHQEAEELLLNKPDGFYLIRRSPKASDYYTLSVRFNNHTKHFKIYYKPEQGHYLQEQSKHYPDIYSLVADGLVNFYLQLHAAPIIQAINQQTRVDYQQSPYMTLNRRKLRALSNELCRSILAKSEAVAMEQKNLKDTAAEWVNANNSDDVDKVDCIENNNSLTNEGKEFSYDDGDDDSVLPLVYEKAHYFKVHTFKGLNWCELCANFLWGFTAQGVKCEGCGFVAHSKCSELVPAKCVPDLKRIRGVFGTDLTILSQLHNCHIPFVVRRCVEEVEARGMLQEGIYRVSGFADEIEALKLALDRDGEKTDMSEAAYGNINVIAGTLKLYLRLLPLPLICFEAYPKFIEAARSPTLAEQIKNMREASRYLRVVHYVCLKYMLGHLKRVASHYAVNKMNEHNLATVFAPTLIATPQHMTNLTEEILMLSTMITNYDKILPMNIVKRKYAD